MHTILLRQIKKAIGSTDIASLPKDFQKLLNVISATYDGFDQDRAQIERSLELSSQELSDKTASLQQKIRDIKAGQEYANELKKASEIAERAKQETLHVLEVMPDSIVIVNKEGEITYVNRRLEHLFGFTKDELIGKKVEILIPERFREIHPKHRTGYFANPRFRPMGAGMELFARKKDATEFPVEISLAPVNIEGGAALSGAIAAIRDISERKNILQELKKRAADLEQANKFMVGRELKMMELKKENEALKEKSKKS